MDAEGCLPGVKVAGLSSWAAHTYGVVRIARGKLQLNSCACPDVVTPQYLFLFYYSVCHQNYLLLFCFFYPDSLPQPNEKYVPSNLGPFLICVCVSYCILDATA
jgi:hypothetical protein